MCCFGIGFRLTCWCWVCIVGGVATLDVGGVCSAGLVIICILLLVALVRCCYWLWLLF